jgi:hypothetical protein
MMATIGELAPARSGVVEDADKAAVGAGCL